MTEQEPLLQNPSTSPLQSKFTAVLNFANSSLGSSVLANAFILKLLGFGIAPIFIIFVFSFAVMGYKWLKQAADTLGVYQYRQLIEKVYPKWVGVIVALCQMIFVFGSLVSYNIVTKDNFFFFAEEQKWQRAVLLAGIQIVMVMPLSWLPTLESLKFNSYIDVIVMIYIDIVLVITFCQKGFNQTAKAVNITENSIFAASLLTHSYAAILQFNFLNLYKELNKREKNIKPVTVWNSFICLTVYLVNGYFGYAIYGDQVKPNVIKNLSLEKTFWSISANCVMIILMIVHIPVVAYPMRKTFEELAFQSNVNRKTEIIIGSAIIILAATVGCFLNSIDNILDFTSSLCGGTIGLVLPGLLKIKLATNNKDKIIAQMYTIIGMLITLFGFGVACYKWLIKPYIN
ncbi:Amino_acid transporter [Hexamita inflata]|uniref:Putative n=1 Tax=Hexamita inflata TaxID=28002 RepID=A0AA86UBY9_9EUKA|nr:Amino acid transporter [Hexamita inflata]